MRREVRRLARLFACGGAIAVAGYSMVVLATGTSALAGGCRTTPTADIMVTQSSTAGAGLQSVTFVATVENEGPCNASGVQFLDTFGGGGAPLQATVVTTNPSNEPCVASGATVSCQNLSKMSAPSDASTNNPGTVVITMSVVPLDGNGLPTSFTANSPPLTSNAGVDYQYDLWTGNNQSQGGFLFNGGDIAYQNPNDNQTTDVHVPSGFSGGGEIFQNVNAPTCPSGIKCFGEHVQINSDNFFDSNGNPALQTLTFVVPLEKTGPQSAGQVVVLYVPDGTTNWVQVPNCPSSPPYPCVVSITKVKLANGTYVFDIVVATTHTSRWGF